MSPPTSTSRDSGPIAAPGLTRLAQPFFLTYCLVVVYATLLPFQFTLERTRNHRDWPLLLGELQGSIPLSDLVGNLVLFIPVGFFAFLVQRHRKERASSAVVCASLYGMLLSLVIEVVQWFTPSRDPASSDVVANALGSILGAVWALFMSTRLAVSAFGSRLFSRLHREPLMIPSLGLLALTSALALVPFDVSLQPEALARALRTSRLNPFADPLAWVDTSHVLYFALLSGTCAWMSRRLFIAPRLYRGLAILAFVTLWAVGLEILQLTLKSRITSTLDVVSALAGGGLGILVSLSIEHRGSTSSTTRAVAAAYTLGLLLLSLRPFGTSAGVEAIQKRLQALIPGYCLHFDATLAGLTEFIHAVILFAPLGFLLGRGSSRRGGLSSFHIALPACGLVALATSLLAAWVAPGGTPVFSVVFPACLGGLLGASVRGWQSQVV